ncbi:MAG: drug/metabolite transporter (DMT)-like permease [Candidatus Endobugula sp.]|jgi:drug/metabolite transporter (DMT)-like permease
MFYLLLTILANVAIFLSFRSFSKFNINTFPAIVTNYFVCVITGSLYVGFGNIKSNLAIDQNWFLVAAILGIVFVSTFYLMAKTTQTRGVAVATVASKMSLAIPVLFSLFIFKIGTSSLDFWNYLGIVIAFVAIYLVSKKQKQAGTIPKKITLSYLALPLAVFVLGGLIDTTLNYANHNLIEEEVEGVFPIVTFASAFVLGLLFILIKKIKVKPKDIIGGIYLGVPNYFSIYFQLKALTAFENNGAILYPTLNIGIIIVSTVFAILLFKEKLNLLNQIGIGLAIAAILLLSYQEILSYI